MIENMTSMYDDAKASLYKLNKARYEERMTSFQRKYGSILSKMTGYIDAAEKPETAAREVADALTAALVTQYSPKGKLKTAAKVDATMFSVYYVMPAILLTYTEHAPELCDAICDSWKEAFGNEMGYTTYEKLRDSFRTTIFGIPIPGGKNKQ